MSDRPMHTAAAHAAIAGELVRLSLGQRGPTRPELRVPRSVALLHALATATAADIERAADRIARALACTVRHGVERVALAPSDAQRFAARSVVERGTLFGGQIGDPWGIPVVLDDTLEPGEFRLEPRRRHA